MNYKVKFKFYQYNSGRADNGTIDAEKSFKNLDDAVEFKNRIQRVLDTGDLISEDDAEWQENLLLNYTHGGYLVSSGDIFGIIEVKL